MPHMALVELRESLLRPHPEVRRLLSSAKE